MPISEMIITRSLRDHLKKPMLRMEMAPRSPSWQARELTPAAAGAKDEDCIVTAMCRDLLRHQRAVLKQNRSEGRSVSVYFAGGQHAIFLGGVFAKVACSN